MSDDCPNFTSQDFFRDPVTGVRRLRTAGPLVETRFPIIGKVWITTTYELAVRVLKDSETFTMRKEDGGLAGLRWWMPAGGRTLAKRMLTLGQAGPTRPRGIRPRTLPPPANPRQQPPVRSHSR